MVPKRRPPDDLDAIKRIMGRLVQMPSEPHGILTGKALKKALAEVPELVAMREELGQILARRVRRMKPGPERDAIEAKLPADLVRRPQPRDSWSSQKWLSHAEYLKATARKWRSGGEEDRAYLCERDARQAEKKGKELRKLGK